MKPLRLAVTVLLVILACKKNTPPSEPMLSGSTMARPGDALGVSAKSYDLDGDSVSYLFTWGDGQQTDWSVPTASGVEMVQTHVYQDTVDYPVSVKARDTRLNESPWSDTMAVSVRNYGPNTPHRPSGPSSAGVGSPAEYRTSALHPLYERVAFRFDWGDGDTSVWGSFIRPGNQSAASHTFTRRCTCAVRAQAKDSLEHYSNWSKPESVFVVDTFGLRRP